MYVHVILLTALVLHFSSLTFTASCAVAEHLNSATADKFCTIPLPDPEQLSEKEKKWFATFQEGTFYVQGWKEITTKILEKIQQESRKEKLRRSLDNLGIRIGCEWSKKNDVRKINTDMLAEWGSELQEAAEKNPDALPIVIADIQQKVFELVE